MSEQRNIVLVTVDSLRADYCGFLGDDRGLTPTMDEMASDGLTFTNAVSPGPSTLDAMPTIFTGADIPDAETEARLDRRERFRRHLAARDTIPDRLSRAGYETAAFTANPWTSREFGFDEGFDHFEDFLDDSDDSHSAAHSESTLRHGLRLAKQWRSSNMLLDWDSFYDETIAWTEQASEPYFLWLFLVDVHMPYLPPSEYRRSTNVTAYASNLWLYLQARDSPMLESLFRPPLLSTYEDTIAYTDDRLGRLAADLAADDPMFVVHSDHGESFGERGIYGHGPLLYRENVNVPLFVANGPTGTIEEPFSLARLPSLLERLARQEPIEALTDSVVRARNHDPKFAARGRDWKYIEGPDGTELYDLTEGEREQIADADLEARGEAAVRRWRVDERERRAIGEALDDVVETNAV